MHSVLFSIGPLTIHTYGLCMAIGFLASWQMAVWLCRRTGQNADRLTALVTWLMLASIIGARIAYVWEHWTAEFADAPLSVLRFDQGGLMFYGGLIGAALVLFVYAKVTRSHLFLTTDLILAVVPLGHAFGRIGCFMHGCCYGKMTQTCWGVSFPKGSPAWWEQAYATPPLIPQTATCSLPVIPTQLIESAANFALFILLFTLYPKKYHARGYITGCYLMSYATLRFCVEFLRGDPRLAVGPFSIGQVISLSIFLGGLFCLAYARRYASEDARPR